MGLLQGPRVRTMIGRRSFAVAGPSLYNGFPATIRDRRWHCTLSSDNSRPICSTSDVSTNRKNIHHRPALLWLFFVILAPNTKPPTYLLTYHYVVIRWQTVGPAVQHAKLPPPQSSIHPSNSPLAIVHWRPTVCRQVVPVWACFTNWCSFIPHQFAMSSSHFLWGLPLTNLPPPLSSQTL